jgi:hypothetical protein
MNHPSCSHLQLIFLPPLSLWFGSIQMLGDDLDDLTRPSQALRVRIHLRSERRYQLDWTFLIHGANLPELMQPRFCRAPRFYF